MSDGSPTITRIRPGRVSATEAARRRDLLLDTAMDEFTTHGFAAANLDRIARNCRISKMTIYRQIGGKENLFLEATQRGARELLNSFQQIVDKGESPGKTILAIIRQCQKASGETDFGSLQMAIAECRSFPEIANTMLEDTLDIYRPVADYFYSICAGSISREQAHREALILMSMSVGGFLKLLGSTEPDSAEWAEDVYRIFMRGAGITDAVIGVEGA